MNLLHIDSSIMGGYSVSRQLSAAVVAKLKASNPGVVETYRDLGENPLPYLTGAHLMAGRSPASEIGAEMQAELAASGAALQEFLAADTLVIGVAFYNFTISSQLKAWIDRLVIAGQTFRYDEQGRPVGLAGGKRIILAIARGGFYGPGMPAAPYEHAETYLRAVFGFMGIYNVEVVAAEGVSVGPEQRGAAIASAEELIAALAA